MQFKVKKIYKSPFHLWLKIFFVCIVNDPNLYSEISKWHFTYSYAPVLQKIKQKNGIPFNFVGNCHQSWVMTIFKELVSKTRCFLNRHHPKSFSELAVPLESKV